LSFTMLSLLAVVTSEQRQPASVAVSAKLQRPRRRFGNFVGVAFALLIAFSMWFYMERVLIPHQVTDATREERPRGNLSDLYPRWLGSRELLLHDRDPYSYEITREIQMGYYGRPLDPARPNDPKDQAGFAYPVYVSFLLAPILRLDFHQVRQLFTWVLAALLLLSVPLWLKGIGWRLSRSGVLITFLLLMGSFGTAQGIKLQQLSLLVAGTIAGVAAALSAGWLATAGILLALSTIKPQLTIVLAAWILLWALSDLRKRWPLVASFGLSMTWLMVGSELVLRGWIAKFLVALKAYQQYTGGESILINILGVGGGLLLTALLLLLLARIAWHFRRQPAGSPEFALIVAHVLAVTVVIIPTFAPYNQVLLIPAILLLVRDWRLITRMGPAARFLYLLVGAMVIWPWIGTLLLSAVSLSGHPRTAQNLWTLPLYTSIMIPFGIMALLAFYTVGRWRLQSGA
jgi:hypothetical protein